MIANLILSGCMLVLSGMIVLETSGYPDYSNVGVIGPDVIPNCLALFIAVIAVILALNEVYKCVKGGKATPTYAQAEIVRSKEVMTNLFANKPGLLRIIATLLLMFLFAMLLDVVGFEICTVVFLVCTMLLNGVRKLLPLVLVPIGTVLVVYVGFVYALRVSIPMLFL